MFDFRKKYTTCGGDIRVGGYVRVFSDEVPINTPHDERSGSAVWHPELIAYGKLGGCTAQVTTNGQLQIRDVRGRYKALIKSVDQACSVEIAPGFIAKNGYIGSTLGEESGIAPTTFPKIVADWERITGTALDQARAGKRPSYLDNSPFTHVTSEFVPYARIIRVRFMGAYRDGDCDMIFDLAGNRFASLTHYPLSYSKWEPESRFIRYSKRSECTFEAL